MTRRRATIRTTHDEPRHVARALEPDDTAEMETRVDGAVLETRIERETTGGLQATADDYVVNLAVAADVLQTATETVDSARSSAGEDDDRREIERPDDGRMAADANIDDTNTDTDTNHE